MHKKFIEMAYLSKGEKYTQIKLLVNLAKEDGVVNIAELSYITWLGKRLELTVPEMHKIAEDEELRLDYPLMESQRLEHFHQLLNLVYVDAIVNHEELEYLREVGHLMSLNEAGVNRVIEKATQTSPRMIGKSEFVSIYRQIS